MSTKLRRELRIDILALILFIAILVVDKTGLLPVVFEHKWISLLVYLVPYFLVGLDVVKDAALGIKNRRPMDESFLMTLATIGAFVTGENSEAVAVMLFYQIGEWFQSYAVGRSRRSIPELRGGPVPPLHHGTDGHRAGICQSGTGGRLVGDHRCR